MKAVIEGTEIELNEVKGQGYFGFKKTAKDGKLYNVIIVIAEQGTIKEHGAVEKQSPQKKKSFFDAIQKKYDQVPEEFRLF